MAREGPLYEDSKLKVTLLQDAEGNIISGEDHEFWIKPDTRYMLPRGTLEFLALSHIEELEKTLLRVNGDIFNSMRNEGISLGDVELALKRALVEEKDRYASYLLGQIPRG
jgi:hypothetical protein